MGKYKIGNELVNEKIFYNQVAGEYFDKSNPNVIWFVDHFDGNNYTNWIIGNKKNLGKGIGGIMSVPLSKIGSGENWPNSEPQNPFPLHPQDVDRWYWWDGGDSSEAGKFLVQSLFLISGFVFNLMF